MPIKGIRWIRIRGQFADDEPKCMEYEPVEHFFKVLNIYLEARIRIRILVKGKIRIRVRIKVTSRIRDADPQHWLKQQ
jgi:hypothetical protein